MQKDIIVGQYAESQFGMPYFMLTLLTVVRSHVINQKQSTQPGVSHLRAQYSMAKKIIIVGGHGNVSFSGGLAVETADMNIKQVSLRLARLLSPSHSVTSLIRNPDHQQDILDTSAEPLLLSLEDASVSDLSKAFAGYDVVYFSAGAGANGGEERTKKVDYEGAVKVFDAIEGTSGVKPRLILVSAVDIRDPEKIPAHYASFCSHLPLVNN